MIKIKIMRKADFEKYGPAQIDGSAFVLTKTEADRIISSTTGNKRALEETLGWPNGHLDSNELVRIDIKLPRELGIRIPSGNEPGASRFWFPGGKLPNGNSEAVVDFGKSTKDSWTSSIIKF